MVVSTNGRSRKWMVYKIYNGKSYFNRWFRGTPISGNCHIFSITKGNRSSTFSNTLGKKNLGVSAHTLLRNWPNNFKWLQQKILVCHQNVDWYRLSDPQNHPINSHSQPFRFIAFAQDVQVTFQQVDDKKGEARMESGYGWYPFQWLVYRGENPCINEAFHDGFHDGYGFSIDVGYSQYMEVYWWFNDS